MHLDASYLIIRLHSLGKQMNSPYIIEHVIAFTSDAGIIPSFVVRDAK